MLSRENAASWRRSFALSQPESHDPLHRFRSLPAPGDPELRSEILPPGRYELPEVQLAECRAERSRKAGRHRPARVHGARVVGGAIRPAARPVPAGLEQRHRVLHLPAGRARGYRSRHPGRQGRILGRLDQRRVLVSRHPVRVDVDRRRATARRNGSLCVASTASSARRSPSCRARRTSTRSFRRSTDSPRSSIATASSSSSNHCKSPICRRA